MTDNRKRLYHVRIKDDAAPPKVFPVEAHYRGAAETSALAAAYKSGMKAPEVRRVECISIVE